MKTTTKNSLKKHAFVYSLFLYPLILFGIFYVYLNVNSILMAFQELNSNGQFVRWVGFDNFREFFTRFANPELDPNLRRSITNSLINSVVGLSVGNPLVLAFAFYVFKRRPAGKIYSVIIMIPSFVSSFIICLLFKKFVEIPLPNMMSDFFKVEDFPHLLTNPQYTFGTCLFYSIWCSLSLSFLMFLNAMSAVSKDILESAKLDGANGLQEFFHIVMPFVMPTFSVLLISSVASIFTASGPLLSFYMYGAPPETYNLGYYLTVAVLASPDNAVEYPYISACYALITLVAVPMTLGVRKFLNRFAYDEEAKI